jgi:dTDP-glucose 4,6-dehydratase
VFSFFLGVLLSPGAVSGRELTGERERGVVTRVAITGGAGFLGSHLCERLLADGAEVVCVDNFLTGRPENVEHLFANRDFRLIDRDVTEYLHVPGPLDAVLHFASPASPVDYYRLPIETLMVGSVGTRNALGLAKAKGARFLLASTSEAYGDPKVHPQPETYWGNVNPVGPRSMYDEAKRFAEALTMAYRNSRGVNTGIIRIFNTYGPRMRANDGRAIPTFISQALRGEPITVAGDGSQTRSVCYVDDLIEGITRLLWSDLPGPVNIGNPHELTILDTARLVRELCGSDAPITFIPRPVDDPTVRQPDITVARERLGWEPNVPVGDGLARTIAWFEHELVGAGQRPAA